MENLQLAYIKARKGKAKQKGVILFELDTEANLLTLHEELKNKTYRTSAYKHFILRDPKVRKISSLPFRDRIVHHAIMNILEMLFVSTFTADTYSCIKGRGIHAAKNALTKQLKNVEQTTYCLQMDVRQFYPSVDHDILKCLIRKKIKDQDLLRLLDEIIDSAPGVPIGNYLSQYFANFYLCYLDHFIKETLGVKRYCRYADDMIIVDHEIKFLHIYRVLIEEYLWVNLKLELKGNYQVFPVKARPIDFVGYPQFHDHIKLRPSIKKAFARMAARRPNRASFASYNGWAIHADTKNLLKKITNVYNKNIQLVGGEIKNHDRRKDRNRKGTG